jgi:hypothetical protein
MLRKSSYSSFPVRKTTYGPKEPLKNKEKKGKFHDAPIGRAHQS